MEPSASGGTGPPSGSSFYSSRLTQPSYQYSQSPIMGDYQNNPTLWVSTPDYLQQHHQVPIIPPTPSVLPSQSMLEHMQTQHQMMMTMQRQMNKMRLLQQTPMIQQHHHQPSLNTYHPQSTTNSQVAMADGFNHEIRRVYQHTQTNIPHQIERVHAASPNVSTVTGGSIRSASSRPRPPRPERERSSTPRDPSRVKTIRKDSDDTSSKVSLHLPEVPPPMPPPSSHPQTTAGAARGVLAKLRCTVSRRLYSINGQLYGYVR